jgi:hypothetical protein
MWCIRLKLVRLNFHLPEADRKIVSRANPESALGGEGSQGLPWRSALFPFRGKYLFVVACIFAWACSGLRAQNNAELLKRYSDSLRFGKTEEFRSRYNDSFKQLLKTSLDEDNAFDINLDSISKTVSVMLSEDAKMRVISWVYINDREEYTNHCVVYHRKKTGSRASIYWLEDRILPKSDSLYTDFPPDLWPGALYYQMYHFKRKGKDYYCVLGLNGKNSFSNRKIIDVLWVDKDDE